MIGFTNYLTEATEQKNTHIAHLEDLALDGTDGVTFALNVLKEFGTMLSTGTPSYVMQVSTKWDGSPSIVFGPDPSGKGFFVATKSAFNRVPKLAHSRPEIDCLYPTSVGAVLSVALERLLLLQPALVLQGDVLFTRDTVREETIEGVACYTFRPNTILYAVAVASALGARIAASEIGLALHTAYVGTGTTLATASAQPIDAELFATLRSLPSVFVVNAAEPVVGSVQFSEDQESDFLLALDRAASHHVDESTFRTIAHEPVRTYLQRYLNYLVREHLVLNALESVEEFFSFLAATQELEAAKRKTVRGRANVAGKFTDLTMQLAGLRPGLEQWFRLYLAINRAKVAVLRTLEKAQSDFGTFVKVDGVWTPTGPEGFVVTVGHTTVKLVDRNEFSRLNFAR